MKKYKDLVKEIISEIIYKGTLKRLILKTLISF